MRLKLLISILALTASGFACGADDATYERFIASRPRTRVLPRYDLLAIRSLGDNGRAQEAYDSSGVLKRIFEDPEKAVPYLIRALTDQRRTPEPIICLWNYTTAGDIAFVILKDMFTDASWRDSTIPGTGWNDLVGRAEGPGIYQLHNYARQYGRKSLQQKWRQIWTSYKEKVAWDDKQRCFVLNRPLKKTAGGPARSG